MRSIPKGFTLVEILVVLVLTAMISGILFQAMERMFRLQNRFGVELVNNQQGLMFKDWFRQTVQGVYPDYSDGKNKFSGSEREFSSLTTNPLNAQYGALYEFRWRLNYNGESGHTQLIYVDQQRESAIFSWLGNSGRFIYVDVKGEAHDTWPPPLGKWPQLPKQIQLQASNSDGGLVLVATPMGPINPLPRVKDLTGIAQ